MICPACRKGEHGSCADLPRLENIRSGVIPCGRAPDGAWCYCAHHPGEEPA